VIQYFSARIGDWDFWLLLGWILLMMYGFIRVAIRVFKGENALEAAKGMLRSIFHWP
jgi:hypothetical protein